MLRESCPANQAHLRSHSGVGSSQVLVGCPTKPEFRIAPDLFRTLILERLRLPLIVCEVSASVDCWLTVTDGTEQHAPTQACCALEPQHQNAHSPECAGRLEQFASTRRWT